MSLNPSGQIQVIEIFYHYLNFCLFYNFHHFLKVDPGQKVHFFSISINTVFSLFYSKNLFKKSFEACL